MRRRDRPRVLALALSLAGAGAAASLAPVGAVIASVHRVSAESASVRLAGIPFSYPSLNPAAWILLGLAVIGASAVAVALRAGLRQCCSYRRFLTQLEVVGHLGDLDGARVDPVDGLLDLERTLVALILQEGAVAWIGEPDAAIRVHGDVVG